MYIAMNRFRIANRHIQDFIDIWKNRESYLEEVPGFEAFQLLRGPGDEEGTLFVSHSTWASLEAFQAWVGSEHFKKSHAGAKAPKGTYLGHPQLEGFQVIL
jgi:heme-degrading monooxygenase HmoA